MANESAAIAAEGSVARTLWSIAILWFLVALASGASGFTIEHQRWVGLLVPFPVAAFAVAFAISAPLRAWAFSVESRTLISFQVLRIGGGAFLALHAEGRLSGLFAVWAGVLDVAIGLSALVLASYLTPTRSAAARRVVVAWMAVGIADFLVAVPLARIARARDPDSVAALGRLPLCMITTYFVPLALIVYFVLGAQLWRQRR